MANRKRNIRIRFRVTPEEKELIEEKMTQVGTTNMEAYLRKMAIDGYILKLDLPELKEMISLLRRCSNNLNQYTKKAHQTGSIYEEDIRDLQERFETFWQIGKNLLARLSTIQ